jgi:hypothetical protein
MATNDTNTDPYEDDQPKPNAGTSYQWNANNVFDNWDLNPLAMQIGGAADGVRDTLATNRDAFLQPLMQQYRSEVGVGSGNAAADDQSLFNDESFRNFVRTGQTPSSQQSATSQWTQQPANPQIVPEVEQRITDADSQNQARNNQLYQLLSDRATQSLALDRNDPIIRAQADAYAANAERARRNYLDDAAEKGGPYINLRGEQRMTAEQLGQQTGTFESQLLGRELQSRRDEIAQSLTQMGSLLTADQQAQLQRELALLDQSIKQQNVGLQQQSLNQDWQQALMQNDQFLRQLGLNDWDRQQYYDLVQRGLL